MLVFQQMPLPLEGVPVSLWLDPIIRPSRSSGLAAFWGYFEAKGDLSCSAGFCHPPLSAVRLLLYFCLCGCLFDEVLSSQFDSEFFIRARGRVYCTFCTFPCVNKKFFTKKKKLGAERFINVKSKLQSDKFILKFFSPVLSFFALGQSRMTPLKMVCPLLVGCHTTSWVKSIQNSQHFLLFLPCLIENDNLPEDVFFVRQCEKHFLLRTLKLCCSKAPEVMFQQTKGNWRGSPLEHFTEH